MLRIVLLDKDEAFSSKLQQSLKGCEDVDCVGTFRSFSDLAESADRVGPVVIVAGVDLTNGSEVEALRQAPRTFPASPIFLLVERFNPAVLEILLRECAKGCALKSEPSHEWKDGLVSVARGELFVSASLTPNLLQHVLSNTTDRPTLGVSGLTDREFTIFQLMGSGLTVSQIADRLGLSARTVESHREKIKHRLGFTDSATVTHFAFLWSQREMAGSEGEKELLSLALSRRAAASNSGAAESLR